MEEARIVRPKKSWGEKMNDFLKLFWPQKSQIDKTSFTSYDKKVSEDHLLFDLAAMKKLISLKFRSVSARLTKLC